MNAEPGADFLTTEYNLLFGIISVAIAVLASYTAIDLAGRVTATQRRIQTIWLLSGAIAMGIGIWAMHFIGMLAFHLPVPVHYNFMTVLASIVPAILASGLALLTVKRSSLNGLPLLTASVLMGLGIASMHYIGMMAMQLPAAMSYLPSLVVLSVVVAIAVSLVGLLLVFQLREEAPSHPVWKKLLAALIMGSAIPAMHYTGMAAVRFSPLPDAVVSSEVRPAENVIPLTTAVVIGTLIILGFSILTAFFDRRLSAQVIYAQAIHESQKSLKAILQSIQVGVLVIGADSHIQLSNQAVLDLLFLTTEDQLNELWSDSITHPPNSSAPHPFIPSHLQPLQPVFQKIAANQAVLSKVVQVKCATDQEPTSLLINAVPLTLPESDKPQMVCTFNDVSKLKQTEDRLKESEAGFRQKAQDLQYTLQELQSLQLQLIQSEKMSSLGQLVAGVAHEINNPVNFIYGNLDPLQEYVDYLLHLVHHHQQQYPHLIDDESAQPGPTKLAYIEEDFPELMQSMRIGAERIFDIVMSLRVFSRHDEEGLKLFDVRVGIDSTLLLLKNRLNEHSDRLKINVDRHYNDIPNIECYPGLLNQVFMNLLVNAVDALDEVMVGATTQELKAHPGQITVRTVRVDHHWVEIAIADNGPGIPKDIKEQIFDPFFTTKPIGKGTGIGLSISYQIIVEKHGGKLECVSSSDGTEFVMQLPIHQHGGVVG
ncbi:MAG: MHYT domain-containing protein [Leptolyngbyaceae bacterium]|nr:MHYT domain-containing protein [Leptolyngbyaceae bacterium]